MITIQDIAPTYYDITTFNKGPVKNALQSAMERIRRKEAVAKKAGGGGRR